MPKRQMEIIGEQMPSMRPEFYRLPAVAEQDVFFGLTRTLYYSLEARGLIQLIRVVPKGKKKGVVLVRYSDMAELMNKLANQQQGKAGLQH